MKIKVLIVEDETLIAQEISACLEENDFEVTGIASTSDEALRLIKDNKPDVILMDIMIKGKVNGIELSKKILENQHFPIIFLTSSAENSTFKKAAEVKPNAFLLKPFNELELPIAIELAFSNHNAEAINSAANRPVLRDAIFVKSGNKFEKIRIEDILYVEADGSYSKIATKNGDYTISFNLSHFHEEIDNRFFCRVHRSFVINISNIDGFDANSVFVAKKSIPISKQYHEKFVSAVKKI